MTRFAPAARVRRLAALALSALALGAAMPGASGAPPGWLVGAGTHFGQDRGDIARSFALMRGAGLNTFRDEIFWPHLEREPGRLALRPEAARAADAFERAAAAGLAPVMILCYGNPLYGGGFPLTDEARAAFAAYAGHLAARFRGKVRYYEVWNEWNGGMGQRDATAAMRSPENYLALLRVTYAAIKAADPSAFVLGGATDGNEQWAERLVALGGMDHMDVLTIHPYMFHASKEGTPERLIAYLARTGTRLAAANGGTVPPVFITETGWPTAQSRLGVTRETQADYLARTLLAVRTVPHVHGLWWYELQDSGTDPKGVQHNFGVVDSRYEPKPAYRALQAVAPRLARSVAAERVETGGPEWVVRLRLVDGTTVVALWTTGAPRAVELTADVRAATSATVSAGAAGYAPGERRALDPGRHRFDLQLGGSPVLVEFPQSDAAVAGVRPR